jgi:hypothetical protein
MESENKKDFRTIRYMKKKNINLTPKNSSEELRNRLNSINGDKNMVVRLRVNSPVFVEEVLIYNRENIKEIVKI